MALQIVKWSEVSPIPSIWAHPCSIEAIFSPRSSGIGLFHVLCMHIPPVVKWRNYFLSEGTFKKPFRIILGSAKMNPWLPKHKGKFWPCKKKKKLLVLDCGQKGVERYPETSVLLLPLKLCHVHWISGELSHSSPEKSLGALSKGS